MRRYVSGIDMGNVSLGTGSGAGITTGQSNVLIGPNQEINYKKKCPPLNILCLQSKE